MIFRDTGRREGRGTEAAARVQQDLPLQGYCHQRLPSLTSRPQETAPTAALQGQRTLPHGKTLVAGGALKKDEITAFRSSASPAHDGRQRPSSFGAWHFCGWGGSL